MSQSGSSDDAPEMESSLEELSSFKEDSKLDRQSNIEVNFDLLDQVSSQLYRNPRRAVEELVCNSYDAGARECYVVTPEQGDQEGVIYVLDNGNSMDEEELDRMWDIADSPKKELDENPDEDRVDNGRQQIGKFGIGKLAAFAVGNKLTHIASKDDRTRAVTVAKEDIEGRNLNSPPKCEIFGMDEEEAKDHLEHHFEQSGLVIPWEQEGDNWEEWTLAVVDDIKPQIVEEGLKSQYLRRMIRTAIPLNTDFEVYLNDQKIEQRSLDYEVLSSLKIGQDDDFKAHLESDLREARAEIGDYESEEDVPDSEFRCENTKIDGYETDQDDRVGLEIPDLGPISGEARIYSESLTSPKREKRDVQDHGYRIRVRGKLVNRGEPLFDTPQKSYKYWSSFIAEIEIPELDDAILLQRDSIDESQIEARIVREVLDSIFNYLRSDARRKLESEEVDPGTFFQRLSTLSPHKTPEALQGLVDEEGVDFPAEGWEDVDVEFKQFDKDRLARYDGESHAIQINKAHSFLTALDEKSFPETSREVVGEALAGQLLSIGYLRHNGVSSHLIDGSAEIVENATRSAAKLLQTPSQYHTEKLETTVTDGSDPFERAVVDSFINLGLDVTHYGASDNPDAVIDISRPGENFRIAVEAKGGDKQSTDHKEASIGTMKEHADEHNCQISVVISSKEIFQLRGQAEDEDSSLLNQVNQHEDISIMTIETISAMLSNHQKNPYDYTQLKNIFEMRSPEEENPQICIKKEVDEEEYEELFTERAEDGRPVLSIEDLPELADAWWEQMPRSEKMVRTILEAAKEQQGKHNGRDTKARVGQIYSREAVVEEDIRDQDIEAVLSSAALTGLAWIDEEGKYYAIHQSVDEIMDKMTGTVA
ncbi:ATP-binding protein [Haloarcula pellucida]|uniref:Histidine kinase-, DNA gyrase B-, and HSP90-like ATPase n=1 Tax=Haloarcula pellucida TaxID=1427151 RepID=A0A830GNA1_9EURY|nr:ATP-binding protein [Halomicroarcula pellucida]MBX0348560.1 ATP-binding protein [Halomicroarcula pellucida]GGN92835.1 hypothetical protein GCM10009030_17480 [Halomicroarcula pellucida]